MNILIIDDEKILVKFIADALKLQGHAVFTAYTGEEGIGLLRKEDIHIVLLDIVLPDRNGLSLLKEIKLVDESYGIIMITAHSSIKDSVTAVKAGAEDYLVKPFALEELDIAISKVAEKIKLKRDLDVIRSAGVKMAPNYHIGVSRQIRDVYALAMRVAHAEQVAVLIEGESGTGKELLAASMHRAGRRAKAPFLAIHCAAMPEQLFAEEFFGYEPGAFADARRRKKGVLELAEGGSVFLDEISELSAPLQEKVLKVIETKRFARLGGEKEIPIDIRFLAATSMNLKEPVNRGRFRHDLYNRISVMTVKLPPLRERKEDIPALAGEFIKSMSGTMQKKIEGIEEDALRTLMDYDWPGNVRELKNVIERAVMLTDHAKIKGNAILLPQSQSAGSSRSYMEHLVKAALETKEPLDKFISQMENRIIVKALEKTHWNVTKAAELLGISRNIINYKFRKKEIPSKEP